MRPVPRAPAPSTLPSLAAAAPAGPFTATVRLTERIPDEIRETFRWRSMGPVNMGGRVTDVEGLPSPSKTFHVAAAAGGIRKTANNGICYREHSADGVRGAAGRGRAGVNWPGRGAIPSP